MEEKDYIYVYDKEGKKTKMELILAINSKDGKFQYIAYKHETQVVPIYMGKIELNDGLINLDTNLTEDEKLLIEKVLKEKITGGI